MNPNTQKNDDSLDLKELFFSLLAQWKLIILCISISLITALLYLRITPNIYSTDALVQVEDGKSAAASALLGQLGQLSSSVAQKSPAEAEIEILNSRLVLGQVIQNLNLDLRIDDDQNSPLQRLTQKRPYQVHYDPHAVSVQQQLAQFKIRKFDIPEAFLNQTLTLSFDQPQKFTLRYNDQVLLRAPLNQANTLHHAQGTWQIHIDSQNAQPKQNFKITKLAIPTAMNEFYQHYQVLEKAKLTGVIGLSYTGTDQQHITQVLNNVLQVYHQQNIERKTLEAKQTLNFLDKQLPELKQQLADSEIKFNKFREKHHTVDVTQESELLLKQNIELEKVKIELKQKYAEMASRYTNDHPLITEVNAQLNAINSKINELDVILKGLPELQRQYLQLYRDVMVNTELYTNLLNSYHQLKVAEAGEIGSVRIIDTAIKPVAPIKPLHSLVILFAICAGAFIGLILAALRNLFSVGLKDSHQIEQNLNLPVYATIPRSKIQENSRHLFKKRRPIPILAVKNSEDIAIESLRSIRTTIHFALNHARNNIIAISGPAPEVGKSFISANLATIFAQNNKKILLMDADLRRGYLHQYFNHQHSPGLSEFLSGQVDYAETIIQSHVKNLDFLPRGKSLHTPSELLTSTAFQTLLSTLSKQYDYIIMDTPPVLAVTDSLIISQYVGVNLVVVRYGKTQLRELALTQNRFEQVATKINGVIINDVQNIGAFGYSYNYIYSYQSHKEN
ncbi:polysaccharide biosynthesis tyrosine autokinase [Acinetobacter larvae]|uniref:Tyrosine protein kinase n=1 Tax=Acinetobacter larvae TaxID=1789224 RepID=A0A1B2LVN1_9GAMM|nr:polysaccharide biosynthesis tyrosine autokinase [Acinetobacter larvae]AOA56986.1 tyrosine protein kinase [Acinetobacter larvae]